jgi:hypothetical protein
MRITHQRRVGTALCAVALGAGALVVGVPASPARAGQTCPIGQIEDATTPGFQCVSACPAGMLVDALTGTCVAPPGLPPPALP